MKMSSLGILSGSERKAVASTGDVDELTNLGFGESAASGGGSDHAISLNC